MIVRTYGSCGPQVIVLHGGPGAPGNMAAVANRLSADFRVIEPFQRRSGDALLTVGRHIDDLTGVIERYCGHERPAIVGHSWGAMLALAWAAAHPELAGPLALIGCGTFDPLSRRQMQAILHERTTADLARRLDELKAGVADPDVRMQRMGDVISPLYDYDPIEAEYSSEPCDASGHEETWHDMLQLQGAGHYPAEFSRIQSPVLMLHGAFDPHPGRMIRANLARMLPQLEYREWEQCGHSPWLEKAVHEEFFRVLRTWLLDKVVVADSGQTSFGHTRVTGGGA